MQKRTKVALVVAAVAAAALGAAPLVVRAAPAAVPVGPFSWSSAIVASQEARTVTVQADVHATDIGCDPAVEPDTTETEGSVTIRVRIVDRPLPPFVVCGAPALLVMTTTVHLQAPLGSRTLIDATDGVAHPALVVDALPSIRSLPTAFVRRSTSWDERTGLVSEWWRWQHGHESQQIDLDFGPSDALTRWGTPPEDAARTTVAGTAAVAWTQTEADTVVTTVAWTPTGSRSYRLSVIDQSDRPMTRREVLTIARSVSTS